MHDLLSYRPDLYLPWNSYATDAAAFLLEEGLEPWLDEEGDVYFEHEGEQYLLATHTMDARLFQLVHLPLYAIPDQIPRLQVHEAVAFAQRTSLGRLIVLKDRVHAEVSHLLPNEEAWRSVFWKSLGALAALREAFHSRLQLGKR